MALSVVRCLFNWFCSMTTSLLLSYTGTNRPRKIHFNTVLISFLFFVSRPVSYLLTLSRKNCLSTSVLLLLKQYKKNTVFKTLLLSLMSAFIILIGSRYFLLCRLIKDVILAIVLLRFPKNSANSILSSFNCI